MNGFRVSFSRKLSDKEFKELDKKLESRKLMIGEPLDHRLWGGQIYDIYCNDAKSDMEETSEPLVRECLESLKGSVLACDFTDVNW